MDETTDKNMQKPVAGSKSSGESTAVDKSAATTNSQNTGQDARDTKNTKGAAETKGANEAKDSEDLKKTAGSPGKPSGEAVPGDRGKDRSSEKESASVQAPPPSQEPEHRAASGEPAPKEPAEPEPHHTRRQADAPASARGLLTVVLLVALVALFISGWLYLQQSSRVGQQQVLEQRLEIELERIRELAAAARATAAESREAAAAAKASIEDAIEATRRANTELRDLIADERRRMAEGLGEQRDALNSLEAGMQSQRQQLLEMRSTDRVDWSLAEAEYLARLAFQRLLMAEDVTSAAALLASADAILRELDDVDLLPAREAIARDLAALRAVPSVDVEGTWLRLQALAERVDGLLLFELTPEASAEDGPSEDADWRERLREGYGAALEKISSFVVVRRHEQPYETLIDPQWEQLVRQNLRMQIAQAQAALLSGNPELYRSSLTTTRRWLQEFFDFNQADVAALNAELDALLAVEISRDYPDIGGSLSAIQAALDKRNAKLREAEP